jgi:hypothetical protein
MIFREPPKRTQQPRAQCMDETLATARNCGACRFSVLKADRKRALPARNGAHEQTTCQTSGEAVVVTRWLSLADRARLHL